MGFGGALDLGEGFQPVTSWTPEHSLQPAPRFVFRPGLTSTPDPTLTISAGKISAAADAAGSARVLTGTNFGYGTASPLNGHAYGQCNTSTSKLYSATGSNVSGTAKPHTLLAVVRLNAAPSTMASTASQIGYGQEFGSGTHSTFLATGSGDTWGYVSLALGGDFNSGNLPWGTADSVNLADDSSGTTAPQTQVICGTYDGTTANYYVDASNQRRDVGASSVDTEGFGAFLWFASLAPCQCDYFGMIFCDYAMSRLQILKAQKYYQTLLSLPATSATVYALSDSTALGLHTTTVADGWPTRLAYRLGGCPARAANTLVAQWALRKNSGNVYIATTGGTTGNGAGPSGTGGAIPDGATVVWAYVGPVYLAGVGINTDGCVNGGTTAQILANLPGATDDYSPRTALPYMMVGGGRNDASLGVATATTIQDLTDTINGSVAISGCPGFGFTTFAATIEPRQAGTGSADENARVATVNAWTRANAASLGAVLVDFYDTSSVAPIVCNTLGATTLGAAVALLTDPSSHDDTVHMNDQGDDIVSCVYYAMIIASGKTP